MKKKPEAVPSPPPAPPMMLDRLPLYYDGSRGALQVTLRNPLQALKLDGPGIRLVPTPDAQDLLSPAIGGGAFFRAIPLDETASWRPSGLASRLESLAKAGEVTLVDYQPPGAAKPQSYLVLDVKTRRQIGRLSKEEA